MEQYQTFRGSLLIVGAMTILALIDNFFSLIVPEGGLWQFHALRGAIMLPMFLALSRLTGQRILPVRPWHVIGRGVVLAAGLMIYFAALGILPIAQVGAGLFTSPIWILVFSTLLFGLRIGIFRILAMLAGFAGVLLILRPDPSALGLLSFAPVLAGAFYALGMIATRAWCGPESTLTLTASLFIALGIFGAAALAWFTAFPVEATDPATRFVTRGWVSPTPLFWKVTLLQAVGSLVALGMLTRAYQIGEASYVAVFEYSFLVFAAGWAWLLWGERLDALSVLGMAVIIVSGTVISLRSRDVGARIAGEGAE